MNRADVGVRLIENVTVDFPPESARAQLSMQNGMLAAGALPPRSTMPRRTEYPGKLSRSPMAPNRSGRTGLAPFRAVCRRSAACSRLMVLHAVDLYAAAILPALAPEHPSAVRSLPGPATGQRPAAIRKSYPGHTNKGKSVPHKRAHH